MILKAILWYWRPLYVTGGHFMILETILWYWRSFYDTGGHFMIMKGILWYWRSFYDNEGHFMTLETILWYWRPFYDTGGHFTSIISRSLHSEMAIYLTCEFLWRNRRCHCLFRVLIMINVGSTKHSESIKYFCKMWSHIVTAVRRYL